MENYSVLMTVYKKDSPEFFKTSVDSMLNQTVMTNDFVLVCDGELTDELNNLINNYEQKYKNLFNVVRLPSNIGLGCALAQGILECKNELVARMDDDDISHKDRCEKQLNFFANNPDIDLLSSYVSEFEHNPLEPIRIKKVPTKQNEILKFSKRRNPFNHSAVMVKKSSLIDAGNYSVMRTNQDVDTWVRMLNQGYVGANIDEVLVDFRFDNNTYSRRKNWKNVKLMIDVWKNFYKKGYCSYSDYLYVLCIQIGVLIIPQKILHWAYDNFR